MISYRKWFLRIVECWNGEAPAPGNADLERYFQQAEPRPGMLCRPFYTILIDLSRSDEALLTRIKRGTRYEIRLATAKDQLSYLSLSKIESDMREQHSLDSSLAFSCTDLLAFVWLSLDKLHIKALPGYFEAQVYLRSRLLRRLF